jgi:hypothetical protein
MTSSARASIEVGNVRPQHLGGLEVDYKVRRENVPLCIPKDCRCLAVAQNQLANSRCSVDIERVYALANDMDYRLTNYTGFLHRGSELRHS